MLNIVGPDYLVPILHLPIDTIKVYARQYPDRLPPRFRPPGIKKLLWVEADVLAWIDSFRPKPKTIFKGRKASPAYSPDQTVSDGNNA